MAPPATNPISFFEQVGEAFGRSIASRVNRAPSSGGAQVPPAAVSGRQRPSIAKAQVLGRRKPAASSRVAPKSASKVTAGEVVAYRQGRGTFDAEVIRIDDHTQTATLQRTSDGKRVVRPLDRVYAKA